MMKTLFLIELNVFLLLLAELICYLQHWRTKSWSSDNAWHLFDNFYLLVEVKSWTQQLFFLLKGQTAFVQLKKKNQLKSIKSETHPMMRFWSWVLANPWSTVQLCGKVCRHPCGCWTRVSQSRAAANRYLLRTRAGCLSVHACAWKIISCWEFVCVVLTGVGPLCEMIVKQQNDEQERVFHIYEDSI